MSLHFVIQKIFIREINKSLVNDLIIIALNPVSLLVTKKLKYAFGTPDNNIIISAEINGTYLSSIKIKENANKRKCYCCAPAAHCTVDYLIKFAGLQWLIRKETYERLYLRSVWFSFNKN